MTHDEAVKDLAVERYVLGELTGEARERFEAHLFDCMACVSDVKESVLFVEAARPELRQLERSAVEAKATSGWAWLWQGWALGPALAACLGVIVYQSAVVLPGMRAQLAESQTPAVLTPLVLANPGARGGTVAETVSLKHGFYLLSVDIPPAAGAMAYRCSLYSPQGELVWHVDVSSQQARDAVTIQVPAATAHEGINELRVQSITATPGAGSKLNDLTKYRYKLSLTQ